MKEQAIKKINKIGKVGGILTTIAKVICILGLIITLVATVFLACVPKDFIQLQVNGGGKLLVDVSKIGQSLSEEDRAKLNSEETIANANLNLQMEDTTIAFDTIQAEGDVITFSANVQDVKVMSLHDASYICTILDLRILLLVISLFYAGFLCKALKNCESPFEENVINKMRHFAYSLIPWVVLTSITESMMNSFMNGRINVELSLDLPMLIVLAVIWALISIFRYGAVLQQESDETL